MRVYKGTGDRVSFGLQSEFWTNCNLFNSKSAIDNNRELQ